MDEISAIAKLLGEDNEKRLKDEITDIFIERIRDELSDYEMYMMDYDKMFEEIEDEILAEVKNEFRKKYMEAMYGKIDAFFAEHFGDQQISKDGFKG